MELKDLVGEHELSGVDTTTMERDDYYFSDSEVVRFVLDGKTYKAIENPEDGYRSYLEELEVTNEDVSNTFPPHKVIGQMMSSTKYETNDVIQFVDAITHKVVLEIGTENTDDYYPYCILRWKPENLAINQNVKQ